MKTMKQLFVIGYRLWTTVGLFWVGASFASAESVTNNLNVNGGFIYNHGAINPGDVGMTFTNAGIRDVTVSAGQLSGVDPETGEAITNSANLLSLKAESLTTVSNITAGGIFVGDGSGLTNLVSQPEFAALITSITNSPASVITTNDIANWNIAGELAESIHISSNEVVTVTSNLTVLGTITGDGSGLTNLTVQSDVDTDGDGMPDWYENQHRGQVMFEDHFDDGVLDPAWVMKRTYWEETDGKLKTVPEVLPDFNYGHWGNGRCPVIVLHEGDTNWVDYSYEFTCSGQGIVSELNPHGLPVGFIGGLITGFRVKEYSENWNEPEETHYGFTITLTQEDGRSVGDWFFSEVNGFYMPGTGFSSYYLGERYDELTGGNSTSVNSGSQANHVKIIVTDGHMYAWINGAFVGEYNDMAHQLGCGGIAFLGTSYDGMAWYDDVVVRSVGLDPNVPDADLDYDNDGFTNLEEYQRDTDPMALDTVDWSELTGIPVDLADGHIAWSELTGTPEVNASDITGTLPATSLPTFGVWTASGITISDVTIAGNTQFSAENLTVSSNLIVQGTINGDGSALTNVAAGSEGTFQFNQCGKLAGTDKLFIHPETGKPAFYSENGNLFRAYKNGVVSDANLIYSLRDEGGETVLRMFKDGVETVKIKGDGTIQLAGQLQADASALTNLVSQPEIAALVTSITNSPAAQITTNQVIALEMLMDSVQMTQSGINLTITNLTVEGNIAADGSSLTNVAAGGADGTLQFNEDGVLSGNTNFFMHPTEHKLAFRSQNGNIFRAYSSEAISDNNLIYSLRNENGTAVLRLRQNGEDTLVLRGDGGSFIQPQGDIPMFTP